MHADLVRASRQKMDLQKRIPFILAQHLIVRDGTLAVFPDHPLHDRTVPASDGAIDAPCLLIHMSGNESQILAVDLVMALREVILPLR